MSSGSHQPTVMATASHTLSKLGLQCACVSTQGRRSLCCCNQPACCGTYVRYRCAIHARVAPVAAVPFALVRSRAHPFTRRRHNGKQPWPWCQPACHHGNGSSVSLCVLPRGCCCFVLRDCRGGLCLNRCVLAAWHAAQSLEMSF